MYKQNLVADILHAGIARSDITTDAKDVLVKDPLYAKALVLDDSISYRIRRTDRDVLLCER